jgi:O-antigen/teichoic acid export membrane protein
MKKKKFRDSSVFGNLPHQFVTRQIRELTLTIGEGALELIINLLAMILVERTYGQEGLGVYSYLLSLFIIGGYLSEFGVPRYVERETALHYNDRERQAEIFTNAFQAILLLGLLFAGFCFLSAAYDTAHTRVQEKMAAYIFIGLAIPLRNLNRLKLAALHGHGKHEEVAKLETKKRLIFLGAIFLLLTIHVSPSYLMLSFLATELSLMAMAARKMALPSISTAWSGRNRLRPTLKEGYRVLFTDEAFDIVLYIDLLILGFYVPSWDLGVYAEASILARFFLLVPMSIRPIFRRKYCMLVANNEHEQAARMVHRTTTTIFYLHSLLVLYVLLYFPEILHTFFHTHGEELLSYRIFTVFVPGLLFSASVTASEPIYEAKGHVDSLRKIVLSVSIINVALNFYLVPFAGFFGAATATMISMLFYFFLFARNLPKRYIVSKTSYLLAGGVVYLTYVFMKELNAGPAITVWLVPVMLFLLFLFVDFFSFEDKSLKRIVDISETQ